MPTQKPSEIISKKVDFCLSNIYKDDLSVKEKRVMAYSQGIMANIKLEAIISYLNEAQKEEGK